jgi:hypothetical protein
LGYTNHLEPKKVEDWLQSPINKKILLLILGFALAFQIFVNFMPESKDKEYFIAAISIANPLIASLTSFTVAKRYQGSIVFGRAYAVLGIALFMMFLGEYTWYTYVFVFGVDEPYPSVADVFFFAFYPLSITHIILNVRFFKTKIGIYNKFWIVTIPAAIILVYAILSFQAETDLTFDFYYGLIFVIVSSVLLSLALLGSTIFRGGTLGSAWILLLIGISLTTIGDVWYFYLTLFDGYFSGHPVELFWYSSYWVMTYALYKHQKIF